MENTVDYFIKKFEAIPENEWYQGDYVNRDNPKQKCVYGHCGLIDHTKNKESIALGDLFNNHLIWSAHEINDGRPFCYPQSTPKARILAALNEIKTQLNKQP